VGAEISASANFLYHADLGSNITCVWLPITGILWFPYIYRILWILFDSLSSNSAYMFLLLWRRPHIHLATSISFSSIKVTSCNHPWKPSHEEVDGEVYQTHNLFLLKDEAVNKLIQRKNKAETKKAAVKRNFVNMRSLLHDAENPSGDNRAMKMNKIEAVPQLPVSRMQNFVLVTGRISNFKSFLSNY